MIELRDEKLSFVTGNFSPSLRNMTPKHSTSCFNDLLDTNIVHVHKTATSKGLHKLQYTYMNHNICIYIYLNINVAFIHN